MTSEVDFNNVEKAVEEAVEEAVEKAVQQVQQRLWERQRDHEICFYTIRDSKLVIANGEIKQKLLKTTPSGLTQQENNCLATKIKLKTGQSKNPEKTLNYSETLFDTVVCSTPKVNSLCLRNALYQHYGIIVIPKTAGLFFDQKCNAEMYQKSALKCLTSFNALQIFFGKNYLQKKDKFRAGVLLLLERSQNYPVAVKNKLNNKLHSVIRDLQNCGTDVSFGVVANFVEFLVEMWVFTSGQKAKTPQDLTMFAQYLEEEDKAFLVKEFPLAACKLDYYLGK